ncbi:MAG: carbohydrate ABC transporter permease [Oscillospiraceae bacterium]|nr:carbohydrate ABC transporter permease [Oscillospiraceae bacterium]
MGVERLTQTNKGKFYTETAKKTKRRVLLGKTLRVIGSIYRFLMLACVSVIVLYPIMTMLTIAIRPADQMTDPTIVWIPKSFTFENIQTAFTYMKFSTAAVNSLIITLGCSILEMISCSMAAYGFARYKFKGRGILFMMVIFTILVPPFTIAIPNYVLFFQFDYFGIGSLIGLFTGEPLSTNLVGSYLAMLLPAMFGVGIRGGLFIYILRQSFRNMPRELEEAAYIDGCNTARTFIQIILPNSRTMLITVFLFAIVWYWNDHTYSSLLLGNLPTLSTRLTVLQNEVLNFMQEASGALSGNPYFLSAALQAGCLLMILPLLLMYIFLQRFLTESIERSGLVG